MHERDGGWHHGFNEANLEEPYSGIISITGLNATAVLLRKFNGVDFDVDQWPYSEFYLQLVLTLFAGNLVDVQFDASRGCCLDAQ